jgi:hypothetical protein
VTFVGEAKTSPFYLDLRSALEILEIQGAPWRVTRKDGSRFFIAIDPPADLTPPLFAGAYPPLKNAW